MSFFTRLALSRPPVTILSIILVFAIGIYSYNTLQRELFPEIELPNIAITAFYPNSDPETVMRNATEPIEDAIAGISGLREIQSVSTENRSDVIATFEFGVDMQEAEREIESSINGITLPDDVSTFVSRISSDTFPIMQFTVSGNTDIPSLQRLLDDIIVPRINRVDGVANVFTLGEVQEQVIIWVDADKLHDLNLSMFQLADAISQNNISLPAGTIDSQGTNYSIRTSNQLGSLQDIRTLNIGFEQTDATFPQPLRSGSRPITISDVAQVELTTADPPQISRANGKPSLTLIILKEPSANTVEVTEGVLAEMQDVQSSGALPPHVEILTFLNNGPEATEALDNLLREGTLGFLFAVAVVFIFLLNFRPSLMRGIALSLRPTIIIAISIPLSVISGVLFMSFTDITLNFMSLAGLAIAVGRVVDDSIVVLENMYRHINLGESRRDAAFNATREVSAAIVSSTLTTVVIFLPLAFIQGTVGQFFSPFAISVSLALLASTVVAITAVPVLGASLLQRGDFPDTTTSNDGVDRETFMQRIYTRILTWTLRRKFITIASAITITIASGSLLMFIPITFFPETTPEFITIDIELPVGTSLERTFSEVLKIEDVLADFTEQGTIEIYQTQLGSSTEDFGGGSSQRGFHLAGISIRLSPDVPRNIADTIRQSLPQLPDDVTLSVRSISGGPPSEGLEINITGSNFNDITATSRRLEQRLADIDGIINISSSISEGKDEVVINVNPTKAGEYSLTTAAVGAQVSQFIVGRTVSEIEIEGRQIDIVLRGERQDVNDIQKLKNLKIEGPAQPINLGFIADLGIQKAPISISRFDNERSAAISATIIAENTRAVGVLVNQAIQNLENVPPSIEIKTGGIFEQINEGFQDVFLAMAIGIVLVYLVMVAAFGSLSTPFVIVLSLPLAIVGALSALFITDRSLSLSALMGLLLLIGIVVTNAIVLLTFVEQLRQRGYGVYDALMEGGRVRLRPILMTAFTTTFALVPLAASSYDNGIIGAELATVVIGGLISSTFLTLIVVPVVYMIVNVSIPSLFGKIRNAIRRSTPAYTEPTPEQ